MILRQRLKKVIKKLDKFFPWPAFYDFVMSREEKTLFDKTVATSRDYLEFGSGGSTIRALQKSKAKISSVDSSMEWINDMRKYRLVRKKEGDRLSFFHIDIGPTIEWGRPANDAKKELFPSYSSKIFELIDKKNLDLVLIDGRFRVACALKTILECHDNPGLKILIHDFWNREQYHVLLNYLTEIDKAYTLGLFKIKDTISLDKVKEEYENYKYDFS